MAKKQTENSGCRFPDGFRILKGKQEYVSYVDHSSIRIWASETETHFDTHMHSAIEVILPHCGTSVYQLPDQCYHVRAGEVLIVPSHCAHSLTEGTDVFRHLLLFEPNPLLSLRDIPRIGELLKQPLYLKEGRDMTRQVRSILMEVIDIYNRREPMWNTQCYASILRMYGLLGREFLKKETEPQERTGRNVNSPIMNSAMTYINEHYMEDVTLEQVAAFTGFSKYYFSRTFRDFTGLSFSEFLTRKRLNVAMDLLIRTDSSIQSVSEAAGFYSTATFNRVFRQNKNCTPTQFRAIYGQNMVAYAKGGEWVQ